MDQRIRLLSCQIHSALILISGLLSMCSRRTTSGIRAAVAPSPTAYRVSSSSWNELELWLKYGHWPSWAQLPRSIFLLRFCQLRLGVHPASPGGSSVLPSVLYCLAQIHNLEVQWNPSDVEHSHRCVIALLHMSKEQVFVNSELNKSSNCITAWNVSESAESSTCTSGWRIWFSSFQNITWDTIIASLTYKNLLFLAFLVPAVFRYRYHRHYHSHTETFFLRINVIERNNVVTCVSWKLNLCNKLLTTKTK